MHVLSIDTSCACIFYEFHTSFNAFVYHETGYFKPLGLLQAQSSYDI